MSEHLASMTSRQEAYLRIHSEYSPEERKQSHTAMSDPLELANALIAVHIPVVICRPNSRWSKDSKASDVIPPKGWNSITADQCDLSSFRPGVDTLAMVGGHGIDVVDIDCKAGATPNDLDGFEYFGLHRTPSGGWHYFVPSTGFAKLSPFIVKGKGVGDYVGGTVDGGGRLLAYLPGSTRPKYPSASYVVEQPISMGAITSAAPDPVLIKMLTDAKGRQDTRPGAIAASSSEVADFITDHSEKHDCNYGGAALKSILEKANTAAHAKGGRHGWAVRSGTRLVELMREGCANADDLDQVRAKLDHIKPEGGTDFDDVMRWAVANATGSSGCHIAAQNKLANWLDLPVTEALTTSSKDDEYASEVGAEVESPSTWKPIDLGDVLDGTYIPEQATLMPRTDGTGLLYPGRLHSFHGESESGKSLAAQAEVARILLVGGRVLYLDFESDHASVTTRLLMLGAPSQAIRELLDYVRPDAGLRNPRDLQAFYEILSRTYDLAIVDGVTEALALLGDANGTPEDRIAGYVAALPRRIARLTGAAVVQVDHVTKSTEGRGRFALGSQHKMNALDGAAYTVEVVEPLGLGLRGVIVLRIAKDRPGSIRPNCGSWRKADRTQEAARLIIDSTQPGQTIVTVEPPSTRVDSEDSLRQGFRPTTLMERVSRYLTDMIEPISGRAITDNVQGKAPAIRTALDVLVAEGYVARAPGPRGAYLHTSIRMYLQVHDPQSDTFIGGDALNPFHSDPDHVTATATASLFKAGDAGRSQMQDSNRVPGRGGTQWGRTGTQSENHSDQYTFASVESLNPPLDEGAA